MQCSKMESILHKFLKRAGIFGHRLRHHNAYSFMTSQQQGALIFTRLSKNKENKISSSNTQEKKPYLQPSNRNCNFFLYTRIILSAFMDTTSNCYAGFNFKKIFHLTRGIFPCSIGTISCQCNHGDSSTHCMVDKRNCKKIFFKKIN